MQAAAGEEASQLCKPVSMIIKRTMLVPSWHGWERREANTCARLVFTGTTAWAPAGFTCYLAGWAAGKFHTCCDLFYYRSLNLRAHSLACGWMQCGCCYQAEGRDAQKACNKGSDDQNIAKREGRRPAPWQLSPSTLTLQIIYRIQFRLSHSFLVEC